MDEATPPSTTASKNHQDTTISTMANDHDDHQRDGEIERQPSKEKQPERQNIILSIENDYSNGFIENNNNNNVEQHEDSSMQFLDERRTDPVGFMLSSSPPSSSSPAIPQSLFVFQNNDCKNNETFKDHVYRIQQDYDSDGDDESPIDHHSLYSDALNFQDLVQEVLENGSFLNRFHIDADNMMVSKQNSSKETENYNGNVVDISNNSNNGNSNCISSSRTKKKRRERLRKKPRIRTYWNALPVDILERIFQMLSIKERHIASQVCPHWFESFYSPCIWTTLNLTDSSFTKRKFNYYLGYQRMIDSYKTQMYLQRFGHNIRRLIIEPMNNFFNLYEFMKTLTQFAQHYIPNQLRNLNTFEFTFGCHCTNSPINDGFDDTGRRPSTGSMHNNNNNNNNNYTDSDIIGTGGKLLEALKELLNELIGLKHLSLKDLLLNVDEAKHLLDNVAQNCYEQLQTLTLINCCRQQCAFLHTGIFTNLQTLIISRQHLDEDVLLLLAHNQHLNDLYIVQNEVTTIGQEPILGSVWKKFTKINHHTQIHLVMVNGLSSYNYYIQHPLTYELTLQPTSVTSIQYDAPIIKPTNVRLMDIGQLYKDSLECIAFYGMPKFRIRKSYLDRVDIQLIYLSENCPRLRTIIINDLISTSTLLLIANNCRNLTKLVVRKNAIRKRFDCSIRPEWRDNYVHWLRTTSRSYEETFKEVSRMLGFKWIPLTDEQFKKIRSQVKF